MPQPPSFVAQLNAKNRPQSSRDAAGATKQFSLPSPHRNAGSARLGSASPNRSRPLPVELDEATRHTVWSAAKTLAEETLLTRRSVVVPGLAHFLIQEQRCDWGTWNRRHSYMPVLILVGDFVSSFRVRQPQTVPHGQLGAHAHTFLNLSTLSDRTGFGRDTVAEVIRQTVYNFGQTCLAGKNAVLDLNFVKLLVADGVDEAKTGNRRLTILWKDEFVKNFEHVVGVEPEFPARAGAHAPTARDSFLNKSMSVERSRPSPRRDQLEKGASSVRGTDATDYQVNDNDNLVPTPDNATTPIINQKASIPQPPNRNINPLDPRGDTFGGDLNHTHGSRCGHEHFDEQCPDDVSPHRRHKLHKTFVRRQRGLENTFNETWTSQREERSAAKLAEIEAAKAERAALDKTVQEEILQEKAALQKRRDAAKKLQEANLGAAETYRSSQLPPSEPLGMLLADSNGMKKNASPRMMIEPRKQAAIPIYPPIIQQNIHDVPALGVQVQERQQRRAKELEEDQKEGKRLAEDTKKYYEEEKKKREAKVQRNVDFFETHNNNDKDNTPRRFSRNNNQNNDSAKNSPQRNDNNEASLSTRDVPDFMGKRLNEAQARKTEKKAETERQQKEMAKHRKEKSKALGEDASKMYDNAKAAEAQIAASVDALERDLISKRYKQSQYGNDLKKQMSEKAQRDRERRREESAFSPYAVLRNDSSDDEP